MVSITDKYRQSGYGLYLQNFINLILELWVLNLKEKKKKKMMMIKTIYHDPIRL